MPPNVAVDTSLLAPFATEGFRAGSASGFVAARAATRAGRTTTCSDDGVACRWSAARARRSSRACGASGRARDEAIGRRRAGVQSDGWFHEGGAVGVADGSRRVTLRGAPSRTARALNALVTVVMVRAFRSTLFELWRRGRRGWRAGPASANVKFQTSLFFFRTCFSSQESLRTCACMSKCRNRQDFARLPLAEEIARIYSNDKPQRRAVIAPVIDTIRVNRADWRMTHDCPCSHVVRFRPTPVAQPVCPPRFNRDGRTA